MMMKLSLEEGSTGWWLPVSRFLPFNRVHHRNTLCIPNVWQHAPFRVTRSSHREIEQSQMSGVTRDVPSGTFLWTCRVGGFTALQAPGCWFSDRWKIVPTSNLWTGSNGKGMEMAVDYTCQASAQNPSNIKWCVFDALLRFHWVFWTF